MPDVDVSVVDQEMNRCELLRKLITLIEDLLGKSPNVQEITMNPCFLASRNSEEVCGVCLESFKKFDILRKMPFCIHKFHANCVDRWWLTTKSCPTCRSCSSPKGENSRP